MDVKSVGQNIKEIREKKKITQKRLAELSGRGESAISNYESGATDRRFLWLHSGKRKPKRHAKAKILGCNGKPKRRTMVLPETGHKQVFL